MTEKHLLISCPDDSALVDNVRYSVNGNEYSLGERVIYVPAKSQLYLTVESEGGEENEKSE